MKKIKFILLSFLFLSFCSCGQRVIYVYNKNDARLIRYTDSLRAWKKNERYKKNVIALLDRPETFGEYLRVTDSLGFGGTNNPTTSDEKLMYGEISKKTITHEYVTCFHSRGGDISKLYLPIVPKPVVTVYYKDTSQVIKAQTTVIIPRDTTKHYNITYLTQDKYGTHADSIKTLVVKPSFTMRKN